ncbi:MAG: SusC/RagA family TonB-linked outer membrane protein [Salinibacter sp.]|uniref:SusC/RagA family TonB-linked outer membrane protein n=1 Tax=Salinibacter sp. TaxID=2065818 RepID=UPI0035D433E5
MSRWIQVSKWAQAFAGLAAVLFLMPATALGQQATLTGTVTDSTDGKPLPGANVSVPTLGPSVGTVTTPEGEYTLTIPARRVRGQTVTVRVRFVGFKTATKQVELTSGVTEVDFTLARDILQTDELVVTGFGQQTRMKQAPFSVNTLSEEEITSVPSSVNPAEAIQGRVPGAKVIQGAGTPGENASIILRGITSIEGGNQPLYVVDGAIMRGLQDLEALDVKSIEVIKGSAAASIYGSRASGGVIRITTKDGGSNALGETRVKFRSLIGFNQLNAPPQVGRNHTRQIARTSFVDPNGRKVQVGDFVTDCTGQPGLCKGTYNSANTDFQRFSPKGSNETNFVLFDDNPYPVFNNHIDAVFDLGTFRRNFTSVSQRTQGTNFRISFGEVKEQGPVKGARGYQRYNGRFNLDHDLTDGLTFTLRSYFSQSNRDDVTQMRGSSSLWPAVYFNSPAVSLTQKNENGKYVANPDSTNRYENPLYLVNNQTWNDRRTRVTGTARLDYQALPWLSFRGQFSFRSFNSDFRQFVDKGFNASQSDDPITEGQISRDVDRRRYWQAQLRSTISYRFLGGLNTRTQFRVRADRRITSSLSANAGGLITQGVTDFGNVRDDAQEEDITAGNYRTDTRGIYGFAQTSLDWKGRYIVNALIRRDGTSRFGAEERWNYYYRLSGAYRPSQEPWWPLSQSVNELKFRYSYGTGGGQPGFNDKFETYNVAGGRINKFQLGNENLNPSYQVEQSLGLNFTIFNRVSGEFTYATSRVENQILNVPLPGFVGYNQQTRNAGTVESYSLEGRLDATILKRDNLTLTLGGTITHTRSRITEFNRPGYRTGQDGRTLYEEGMLFGKILGNKYIRDKSNLPKKWQPFSDQFAVNDEGFVVAVGKGNSWKDGIRKELWGSMVDINGDGKNDFNWGYPVKAKPPEGRSASVIANTNPDFFYGFNANLDWRNFTVRTLWGGQYGGDIYNFNRHWAGNNHKQADQRGKSVETKKPVGYQNAFDAWNNRYVEDGTYLKLRELAVNYTFDSQFLEQTFGSSYGIDDVTIGITGKDLLTFTGYSGWDPEVGSGRGSGITNKVRIDYFRYPNYRSFQANLEINF